MTRMPLEFEEQAVQEDALPSAMPFSGTRERGEGPGKPRSVAGVVLGAIALILALALGVFGL